MTGSTTTGRLVMLAAILFTCNPMAHAEDGRLGAFVAMCSRSNSAKAGWMYGRASCRFFVDPALHVMNG